MAPTAADSGPDEAHEHFDRALELYRGGRYAAALRELEQAAKRDPSGKDLFFNLALVHEKLGQLPEAVTALERYLELETDRGERERARLTIERLRGAERELEAATKANAPCAATPAPPPPRPRTPDPVLVGAASIAAVSLVVGTVFGLEALSDDVKNERTSAALPVDALRERARRAERAALIADVAFAVAAAGTATIVGIWLLTPREPTRAAGITLRGYF